MNKWRLLNRRRQKPDRKRNRIEGSIEKFAAIPLRRIALFNLKIISFAISRSRKNLILRKVESFKLGGTVSRFRFFPFALLELLIFKQVEFQIIKDYYNRGVSAVSNGGFLL